jgi:GR25 family glycosyltransferase involved in LPS biosynthesis
MKWIDKIYIITLPEYKARQDKIYHDLLSAGFDEYKIEWIKGVKGDDLDVNKMLDDGEISDKFYDPNGSLTRNIYGCALSHQRAYERFLEESKENPNIKTALILEDDAALSHTALRTLTKHNKVYELFQEEADEMYDDWGVIMLGGIMNQIDWEEEHPDNKKILKRMKYSKYGYAGHSYVINPKGAEKLIESNKKLKYAADTNIHLADTKIFTPTISYFVQKVSDVDRLTAYKMAVKFENYVLYNIDEYGREFQSQTAQNSHHQMDADNFDEQIEQKYDWDEGELFGAGGKTIYTAQVARDIEPKKLTFEPFTAENGDTIKGWVTVNLR